MPGRTGSVQRLRAPESAIGAVFGTLTPGLAEQLRAAWEAVNNGWNQWVLNYTQSRQLDLLKNLGFESPRWEDLGLVLIGLIVAASLAGAAWTLWERSRQDPWLRLLGRVRQRLAANGVVVPPQAGPRQMAAAVLHHLPASGVQPGTHAANVRALHDALLRLEQLRYAPHTDTAAARRARLAALSREFRRLTWPAP
jgi:hypothetical protein